MLALCHIFAMPRITSMPSVRVPHAIIAKLVFNMWIEQTELDSVQRIYILTKGSDAKQNWRKLLTLGDTLDKQLKRKLLWIWPTALDLKKCNEMLVEIGIRNVLSIGCGSGLLEWLLAAVGDQGIHIYGLERDPNWWRSKYAMRSFISLNYVEDAGFKVDAQFLIRCCFNSSPCALLFCYFNNRSAFDEYMSVFDGKWLILIGPQPSLGIHTDPNPLQPHLSTQNWTLRKLINWTEHNLVAFYERLAQSS